MKNIVIIGAGGFGREVAALIQDINLVESKWNFLGFIDEAVQGETVEGYPVLGNMDDLAKMDPKPCAAIAIADSAARERLVNVCKEMGIALPSLIHPTVVIGPKVVIGEGCIIGRNAAFTTNVQVGNYCILNIYCTFGHDTRVEDYVSMMSHTAIAGDVVIGRGCYFGLHCTVINLVTITAGCTFGAGCVVARNIDEPGTYVGVPAKRISR